MSACCTGACSSEKPPVHPKYRHILWIALLINATMFFFELIAGWSSGSASLLADAVDFFGDAANYAVSLFVLRLAPIWHVFEGTVPRAQTMGAIGFLALAALGVFGTGTGLPEVLIAGIMGLLGVTVARSVISQTRVELNDARHRCQVPAQRAAIQLKRR